MLFNLLPRPKLGEAGMEGEKEHSAEVSFFQQFALCPMSLKQLISSIAYNAE